MSIKSIRCGMCGERHETVDLVRECHLTPAAPRTVRTKQGKPVRGDHLVLNRFTWEYACDICGRDLLDRDAVHRPAPRNARVGGWCRECATAYGFDDLLPTASDPGDPDKVNNLYHFTDSRNVASIERRGILSLNDLVDVGIAVFMSSTEDSRERDRTQRLSGFVRLTLYPHHPMAWKVLFDGRSPELTWLEIDRSILESSDPLYSDKNALAGQRVIGRDPLIATRGTDQAEVMVRHIPTEAILGVVKTASV